MALEDAVRIVLEVTEAEDGERLDRLIARRVPDMSRSFAQQLVKGGDVRLNDVVARPALRVHHGDRVDVLLPPVEQFDGLVPEYVPLPILYEDGDVIVFDKPAGMVTHPAPGHERGTLVNVLRGLRPDLPLMHAERPGIVHRLDKDTSGLIVVAKNETARRVLLHQWQHRRVVKRYTALVHGVFQEDEGTIDAPISRDPHDRKRMAVVSGGRQAVSHFRVLERFRDATLVSVIIETGRTHQIRVHLTFIGYPIVGDPLYGRRPFGINVDRQLLHASYLKFELPSGKQLEVETGLPRDFQSVLQQLRLEETGKSA